jgi:DNA polymerase I-like protein with 3'-5' exonuclease and polymerase domains
MEVYLAQQGVISDQGLSEVLRLECDLTPVLADMSWHGVRVDLEAAHASIPVLDAREHEIQKEVDEMVGRPFNVNSTPQIRDFFKPEAISKFQWRLIDGTLVGPTKGGKGPSLGQDALRTVQHPLAEKILALRKTIKLRDTFVRGHVIGSADGEGYVHTQFNQTRNDADAGTVTGRLSSTDPALQQITKRDKKNAAILRSMFLPDAGESWLCEDYSQVDFRCGAHLQNDPNVIHAYSVDHTLDYHQIVSDMTGIPRNPPFAGAPNTKQINLGLSFGAGAGKLAFMMGMPYEVKEYKGKMSYIPGNEASRIFEMYHAKLPAVKTFMKKAENVARDTGYVRTAVGRRLRFHRGMGAHKAAGLLYQAYAADLHKLGLVAVDNIIRDRRLPARLMMSCHDEIGVSTKPDQEVLEIIRDAYTDFNSDTSPVRMRVPITASAEFGANWYEASK